MRPIILYSTLGCHLCELAKEQIEPLIESYLLKIEEIDIATSDDLMEKYGVKIPVLELPDSQKILCWPFDTSAINLFLQEEF